MRKIALDDYCRDSKAFSDLIIIFSAATIMFLLAMKFGLFQMIHALQNHFQISWEIDEVLPVILLFIMGFGVFSLRRWQELTWEVNLRTRLQGDLLAAVERAEREKAKTAAIIAAIGDGISIQDRDYKILYQNDAMKVIVGEHVGAYCYRAYEGNETTCPGCPVALTFNDGKVHVSERTVVISGHEITVEITASPIRGSDGEITASIEAVRDITERKRAESALLDSEWRFYQILENIRLAAVVIDVRGRIIFCNDFLLDQTGWKLDEVVECNWFDLFIPSEIKEEITQLFSTMIAAGEFPAFYENEIITRLGERRLIRWSNIILRDLHGNVTGTASIGEDITERKRSEEALRRSEERFKLFIENLPGIVFMKDPVGRYVYINDACRKICAKNGITELLGRTDAELWPPAIADDYMKNDRQVLSGGKPLQMVEAFLQDGEEHYMLGTKFPILDDNGVPVLLCCVGMDITEQRKVEDALLVYQEQLSLLAAELSLAEERERRRFASELHDQVGQTLAFAKIKLNELAAIVPSVGNYRIVEDVRDAINQSINEVRSLTFQISPPVLYEIGLESAITWLCDWCREKYGFHVEVRNDNAPKPLAADVRGTLYQAVRELVINAVKHARTKRALISINRVSDKLVVKVEDEGVGFDVSTVLQERVKKGGFGLFNIRQRINHLGGEFVMESEIGRGTRFTFLIPLSEQQRETEESLCQGRKMP